MGDLRLTNEEREIFEAMARDRNGRWSRLTFYGSIVGPFLAFAVYGAIKRDLAALLIAFGGLFLFLLWRLSYEFDRLDTYKAACKKVVEHERTNANIGSISSL